MSYILDALKKSEQDRVLRDEGSNKGAGQKEVIADAVAISAPQNGSSSLSSIAVVISSVALVAAVVILFVMFWGNYSSTQPAAVEPVSRVLNDFELLDIEKTPPAFIEPVSIEQIPESIASELAPMSISSHIYSTEANRRSIVVNDQRLTEGDYVFAGVQIKQITHQGMIIVVQGRSFIVNRSRGWGL